MREKQVDSEARVVVVSNDDPDWDWWTVELDEHANIREMRPFNDGTADRYLYYSGRISDACVEGGSSQMLEIAYAIENHGEAHFKRCALVQVDGGVAMFSPRNSLEWACMTMKQANELAADIRAKVRKDANS